MSYVAVTVEFERRRADLALPLHVPGRLMLDGLLAVMGIPPQRDVAWALAVRTPQGLRRLPVNARLGEIDVRHGAVLVLLPEETTPVLETGAFLEAENGVILPLHGKGKEMLLGRNDPKSGIFVDVDLSLAAAEPKAISRRHARIEQEGDRFYLADLGSANGTKLNNRRLPPHEKQPLWDGDVIELGRGAARLIFHSGQGQERQRSGRGVG